MGQLSRPTPIPSKYSTPMASRWSVSATRKAPSY